jgi:hypothetical protein
MKYCLVVAVLIVSAIDYVTPFSSGVPNLKTVCKGMTPQHDDYKPQTSAAPFQITLSSATVTAGKGIEVTLKSTSDATFKGFYLQGRNSNGDPIGSFVINKDAKAHSCNGLRQNAAHHANGKEDKSSMTVTWESPADYEGNVQFIGTFVKDFVHIWAGVKAEPLTVTKN